MFEPIVGPATPFLEEQGYVPCVTVPSGDPERLRYARDAWATSEPRMYAPTRLPHRTQALLLALILSWFRGLVAWMSAEPGGAGCGSQVGPALGGASRLLREMRRGPVRKRPPPIPHCRERATQATHRRLSVHHNLEIITVVSRTF